MRLLTPIESIIIRTHPDALELPAILFLQEEANAGFLAEYRATWHDVVESRRIRLPVSAFAQAKDSS